MKPFLSVEQQVAKLRANGLMLEDRALPAAEQFLQDHNYYRLSGYFRYFQFDPAAGNNRFDGVAAFADIRAAYVFDHHLARKLLEGLADIEVVFRSRLAYLIAQSTGPGSYLDAATYERSSTGGARAKLLADINLDIERSRERFVHHHSVRGETMPVWAAVETMSLGTTSKMLGLIADFDGVFKPLARRFDISPRGVRRIFRSITVLRNVCAHHSRIWNRTHGIDLEAPKQVQSSKDKAIYRNTPWAWVVTVGHLADQARNDESFSDSLWDFLDAQPDHLVEGLTHPDPR